MPYMRSASLPVSRRAFGAGAAATGAALALAACGPDIGGSSGGGGDAALTAPDKDAAKGRIVIWDRSGDLFDVFEAVIPAFRKKYPGIEVDHQAVDIESKLQSTLITGTDVPDGVFLDDARVGSFVDHLWDLSTVLKPYTADIAPQKLDSVTTDGKLYGVPYDLDPGLLFYNETALAGAGIQAESIETYDDLLAAARAYKQARPDAAPIHLERSGFLGQLQLEMFASQQGTSLCDAEGKLRLDSAPYEKALTFLDTVRSEQLGTRAEYLKPEDIASLENGTQVFYPWAMWFSFAVQQLLPQTTGSWRAMPLPAWEAGSARSGAMGGSSFVIPRGGKNSQLAWLFYEFLMFDPAGYTAVWGKSTTYPEGLNTSVPAYTKAADPAKPLFGPVAALGGQDLWKTATEAGAQIPGGTPIPSWFAGAVDYLGTDIQKMLDGDLTPRQVIDQATTDIQHNLIDRP